MFAGMMAAPEVSEVSAPPAAAASAAAANDDDDDADDEEEEEAPAAGGDAAGGAAELERLQKEKETMEDQMQAAVDADDFDEASRLQEIIDELGDQIDALE